MHAWERQHDSRRRLCIACERKQLINVGQPSFGLRLVEGLNVVTKVDTVGSIFRGAVFVHAAILKQVSVMAAKMLYKLGNAGRSVHPRRATLEGKRGHTPVCSVSAGSSTSRGVWRLVQEHRAAWQRGDAVVSPGWQTLRVLSHTVSVPLRAVRSDASSALRPVTLIS